MSVDISDPQIGLVRSKIQDQNDPTTWFILHYSTSSTSSTPIPSLSQSISLLSSGPEPVLPNWQKQLSTTNEDILFGYEEIAGKGLVLLFLRDSVGGVKRARAVVHSRAVASLFPDYSALITIAHHSQLTEELITERLGLNHSSTITSIPKPKYSVPGSDHPNPLSPLAPGGPMPFLPNSASVGSSRSVSASYTEGRNNGINSNNNGNNLHYPSPKKFGTLSSSRNNHDTPDRKRVISLDDPPIRKNTSSPGPVLSAPISLGSPVRVDPSSSKGISSSDYFGKEDPSSPRSRKTSFGVRLKNTFTGNKDKSSPTFPTTDDSPSTPSSQINEKFSSQNQHSRSQSQSQTGSPNSPKESRFKNNSIVKAFHRRRSSTQDINGNATPPDSPQPNEFGFTSNSNGGMEDIGYAPPVPPKDLPQRTTSTTIPELTEQPKIPLRSEIPTPSSANTAGHGSTIPIPKDSKSNQLSPSPSARQALYDARQKSLTAETEIQDRFRRDQEERMRANGNGHLDGHDTDEESVRLAYDQSEDEDDNEKYRYDNAEEEERLPKSEVADGNNGITPRITSDGQIQQAERISQAAEEHAEREAALRAEEERVRQLAEAEQAAQEEKDKLEAERIEAERKLVEERQIEEERIRLERIKLEEEAKQREEERIRVEAEERARREFEEKAELDRLKAAEEAERARVEAEEKAERARIEAEDRAKREAERARLEAEQAAERARIEAEELARKQAEEAELLRIRQLEEEERIRKEVEEKARLQKEEEERAKLEEERRRKEGIQEALQAGKREGGIMLRGWVTVQTYKSMTWRRRYFHLLPHEMQLYKAESDAKPIQTIYIGASSTVSEKYEESQVKDSFKVISDSPKGEEEFFLFTDSHEDKETVLQGLRLCMA